jgi:enoyl-CoA hydratase/carnithine racemase
MVKLEEELCHEVFTHPDAQEGMAAFFEKRRPDFADR